MKKAASLLLAILYVAGSLQSQTPNLVTQTAPGSIYKGFTGATPDPAAQVQAGDTLHYFFNKHYFRNPTAPSPAPNLQFLTITSPYAGTQQITHCGAIFLNNSSVTVTGLEGLVMRHPSSANTNASLKFYLCNVNASNLPILPPLDSVITTVSTSSAGVWAGADFTTPVTVTGKFAVLYNVGDVPGDSVRLFLNNACTATSTAVPPAQRFGEGLSVMRFNGTFYPTTGVFSNGPAGNDYEFIVAPRVNISYSASVAAATPTICTNSNGIFANLSSPTDLLENRQFNFNKFGAVWGQLSNTLMPTTDSIYYWTFTSSPTGPQTTKNAVALFNVAGNHSANLSVRYRASAIGYWQFQAADVASATLNVSSTQAPSLTISGNTAICSGLSTTLTVTGNPTYTWTNPVSNASFVVVSPNTTTTYSVTGVNGACVGVQTVVVTVSNAPTVTISGPNGMCVGASTVLTASGANTYSWNTSSTSNAITITSNSATLLSYTATGFSGNCPPSIAVKQVTVHALPSVSLTAPLNTLCTKATGGSSIALNGEPSGGQYFGNQVVAGVFNPNNQGNFIATYVYTNTATGCSKSATTTILVVNCTGLENNGNYTGRVTIYPNPIHGGILNLHHLEGKNSVEVFNLTGQLVHAMQTETSSAGIDLSNQPSGCYFIKITHSSGESRAIKFVNQH